MMEATGSSGGGVVAGEFAAAAEMAETLRFQEEIQSLMHNTVPPMPPSASDPGGDGEGANTSASFTALLGLNQNQAMELLHGGNGNGNGGETWRFGIPLGCSPTFPSNAALVERAARFSVFASAAAAAAVGNGSAAEESPQSSSGPAKIEPADSGSPTVGQQAATAVAQRQGKRKENDRSEKSKGKGTAKKSRSGENNVNGKTVEENNTGGDQKLPYVHVRARRGQATDSHSLAERARREKINARMKLLQELVPGCNKISGTAMVLDEIINHVQSLQRQVEFLSMRLAAVNPRIDFGGFEAFVSASTEQCGGPTACNGVRPGVALGPEQQQELWPEVSRRQLQPIWHAELVRPPQQQQHHQHQSSSWDRDSTTSIHPHHHHQQQAHQVFINSGSSSTFFPFDSTNSVPLHPNQLKTEL